MRIHRKPTAWGLLGLRMVLASLAILLCLGMFCQTAEAKLRLTPPFTGLKIVDFDYVNHQNQTETMTAAIWFPTTAWPSLHIYHMQGDYYSMVSANTTEVLPGGPYPVLFYLHGLYSSGYDSAFLAEYLARQGYIVVALDFRDLKAPDYLESIAFSTIRGGMGASIEEVTTAVAYWGWDMTLDREFLLDYLADRRLAQSSFIIDEILALNNDSGSMFYQTMREDAIGTIGYSLGGTTALGLIGAHPDPASRDSRIKAALLISPTTYPFEETLSNIEVPFMLMAGEYDPPALGQQFPRRMIYDHANVPRYHAILVDGEHHSFANVATVPQAFFVAVESNPKVNVVCRYGHQFFKAYLEGDPAAVDTLRNSDPQWLEYEYNDAPQTSAPALDVMDKVRNIHRQPMVSFQHSGQTQLLANYPNPFNPETWFPYVLGTDASVSLRIFSPHGQLVRQLDLGNQSAGLYLDRGQAAYWDGKDSSGQPVASGSYFYMLQAGDHKEVRKLVIQK